MNNLYQNKINNEIVKLKNTYRKSFTTNGEISYMCVLFDVISESMKEFDIEMALVDFNRIYKKVPKLKAVLYAI
jgi:hypothetical protein